MLHGRRFANPLRVTSIKGVTVDFYILTKDQYMTLKGWRWVLNIRRLRRLPQGGIKATAATDSYNLIMDDNK